MESEIQNFFRDQTIFITGGTGFIGKVLIEKLLRVCYDLKTIYIVVRPKKGSSPKERFKKLFDFVCFEKLKTMRPNFFEKVQLIEGDCTKPNLGLSQHIRDILKNEVTVLVSAAADVRFDQKLRDAVTSNVKSVYETLNLAKEIINLKAFIYVSTAYSNPSPDCIYEKFYEPVIQAETLFRLVDSLNDETLEILTPELLKNKWPNVYTFSKSIAEDLVKRHGEGLPLAIIRPGIIMSSVKEPLVGWIDNLYGIVGLGAGIILGAIRSVYYIKSTPVHTVPCDYVVNCLLAAIFHLSDQKLNGKKSILIYNFVPEEPITAKCFGDVLEKTKWKSPSGKMFWFPSCSYTENYYYHKLHIFIFHILLPYIIDVILWILGRKPIATREYRKINKFLEVISYFCCTRFQFHSQNVKNLWQNLSKIDQDLFTFNLDNVEWDLYLYNSIKHGRVYLFKESLEDKSTNKRKMMFFAFLHYTFTAFVYYFILKIFYNVFSMFL